MYARIYFILFLFVCYMFVFRVRSYPTNMCNTKRLIKKRLRAYMCISVRMRARIYNADK